MLVGTRGWYVFISSFPTQYCLIFLTQTQGSTSLACAYPLTQNKAVLHNLLIPDRKEHFLVPNTKEYSLLPLSPTGGRLTLSSYPRSILLSTCLLASHHLAYTFAMMWQEKGLHSPSVTPLNPLKKAFLPSWEQTDAAGGTISSKIDLPEAPALIALMLGSSSWVVCNQGGDFAPGGRVW